MPVLHPSTSTEMAGPVGEAVNVIAGVLEEGDVGVIVAVENEMLVAVAMTGVEVAGVTPITTGVAVKIEGVFVRGRKGVGGLNGPGWITQPLQDANRSISRIAGRLFFISSPPCHCTPHVPQIGREEACGVVSCFFKARKVPFALDVIQVLRHSSGLRIGKTQFRKQCWFAPKAVRFCPNVPASLCSHYPCSEIVQMLLHRKATLPWRYGRQVTHQPHRQT